MYLPISLQENLIGYWPLDETGGTTAYDYGSGGKNGTIAGTPIKTKMTNGKLCLFFDGSDDVVTMGTYLIGTEFTTAFWFRTGLLDGADTIYYTGSTSNESRVYFSIYLENFYFSVQDQAKTVSKTCTSPVAKWDDDEWHFAVGIKDGNSLYCYIDCVLDDDETSATSFGAFSAQSQAIGNSLAVANKFNGDISDVIQFDKALSLEEIKSIYKSTYRR